MTCISIGSAQSREIYDQVASRLRLQADPPAGLIVQTAAESPEGVKIVSVWESREAMSAFERERVLPALRDAPDGSGSRPEVLDAFEVVRGDSARTRRA